MVAVDLLDNVAKLAVEGRNASVARLDHGEEMMPVLVEEALGLLGVKLVKARHQSLAGKRRLRGPVVSKRAKHEAVELEHAPQPPRVARTGENEELLAKGEVNGQAEQILLDVGRGALKNATLVEPDCWLLGVPSHVLARPQTQLRKL